VVGAGISGLAAAWFYRHRRPDDTILLLDNHDDFGGHAKRNEFTVDGRFLLGYGGSEAMQSPEALYGPEAKQLLTSLGVDHRRFEDYFDTDLYPSLGLSWADPFEDQKLAGGILWAGGEAVSITMLAVLIGQWMKASEREARRIDRQLDREEAEERARAARAAGTIPAS